MEFERAIFRVYERCVEGLRDDEEGEINSKSCRAMELITLVTATFFLFCLLYLHFVFVGQPGCLPQLLEIKNLSHSQPVDLILQLTISDLYTPDNSGIRDLKSQREGQVDDTTGLASKMKQIMQLQNMLGPSMYKSSFFRNYREFPNPLEFGYTYIAHAAQSIFRLDSSTNQSYIPTSNMTNTTANMTYVNDTDASPYFDYEFAFNVGELILPNKIRKLHNFQIVNLTLSTSQCFGNAFTSSLAPLGGFDTIILNNLMHTFKKAGHLITSGGDYYSWSNEDVNSYSSIGEWLLFKILILLLSVFIFFLLSSATALLVRVLISSGVVILLPIFALFQLCGVRMITNQILRLSYPWIGVPMEMLRARNQSVVPFLIAHISRVILYYVFYEACQMTFAMWFYNQQLPGQRELFLFAIMMLWEYYGMIYVRAKNSILLFPKAVIGLFLIYHFYLYSQPFGFHILALLVMFLYSLCVMIHCVRKYELQAYYRGIVNIDRPRMIHNSVPWPTWSLALAPDFTLFLPVTEEATDIYTGPVPNRDVELGQLIPEPAAGGDANPGVSGTGRETVSGDARHEDEEEGVETGMNRSSIALSSLTGSRFQYTRVPEAKTDA